MINIKIEYETNDEDTGKTEMVLTNEGFDNYNYLGIIIKGKEYQIAVSDLYSAMLAFKDQQKSYK